MKICAAQTKPIKGDISANIEQHIKLIHQAGLNQAQIIIFPELSLTGYEPELAKQLAVDLNDTRLDIFQQLSELYQLVIGVGIPTKQLDNSEQIFISMLIFQPKKQRIIYSKQHFFESESAFFCSGRQSIYLNYVNEIIAPVICYELSNSSLVQKAKQNAATVYMASVLNSVNGVDSDLLKLAEIAKKYQMTVSMSNFVGESGGYQCAGKSAIWNVHGEMVGQLSSDEEALLIYDIDSKKLLKLNKN